MRGRQSPDAFVPFLEYCRQRLADDPHLWASTLFDEVVELGYAGVYSTFTRASAALRGASALRAVPRRDRAATMR